MKLLAFFTVSLVMALAIATEESTAQLPALTDFELPADHQAVEVAPAGHELILEEGPAEESDANPIGQPESIPGEKSTSHEVDNQEDLDSLADDNTLDSSAKDLDVAPEPEQKQVENTDSAAVAHFRKVCKPKCRLGRGWCPRLCKYRRCVLRFTVLRRIKYRVRVCKLYRIRIRYRVKVRYCKRVYKYGKWRCIYKYKFIYKYKIKLVKRCKYVTKYRIVKKYIYKRGYKCLY